MAVSYKKLWHILIDRKKKKHELSDEELAEQTIANCRMSMMGIFRSRHRRRRLHPMRSL